MGKSSPVARQCSVDDDFVGAHEAENGARLFVEQIKIQVEDAHFIAVEMNAIDQAGERVLTFRTNVGDVVEAGPDHPLRFETAAENEGVKPYLAVRGRLEALLSRPVMYELISHGEEIEIDGEIMFAIRSKGAVFPIMPADELSRLSQSA